MNRFEYNIKALSTFTKSEWDFIFKYVSLHKDTKIYLEEGQIIHTLKKFVDGGKFLLYIDSYEIGVMLKALEYPTTNESEEERKSMIKFSLHITSNDLRLERKRVSNP